MTIIANALQAVRANILHATSAANRHDTVQLLAVSKAQPAEKLREAYLAGQTAFGENYVQEAINKQTELADCALDWHFIGPIQSNKTQLIAQHFSWVHSVDRLKVAQRLSQARPDHLAPLNICIQVNSSQEASKSGVALSELLPLAQAVNALPKLRLRGLMAIPAPAKTESEQRAQFQRVRVAFIELQQAGFMLDTLSIGMSEDYMAAIQEGATIVRIGAAIFGARN